MTGEQQRDWVRHIDERRRANGLPPLSLTDTEYLLHRLRELESLAAKTRAEWFGERPAPEPQPIGFRSKG